ncbi:hypothetical protein KUTeg_009349 [Tegillarca granosa]|uniref:TIR domain-containing protein n=1 Tax=Tegillarca granosa TaxID=220873 RepID=A0ABQ9F3K0_TEGGR|nr:hypothetical protein KUTeg_009349 [Tegillarca granosa]
MASALESEFKDLSLQEDFIKPGLFHLSLNSLYQPDSDTLNERKKSLQDQLEEEHPMFKMIFNNLIALINHRIPRSQNKVRSILEDIRKDNPKHLNTLANLEVIYKELHRRTESDRCKQEKEAILCRNDQEALALKAQYVLEQACSLIIEETTNHEGIANHRLRDSLKILSSEHERSSGERQKFLGKALRYAEQASSCVLSAMYCDRPDEQLERKKESIEKFLQGLKMLETIGKEQTEQYHIWRYYLGVTLNRYDFSIYQKEDDDDKQEIRKELNAKVLEIFWSTICSLKGGGVERLYMTRSYAYIGHLLISRTEIADDIIKSEALKVPKQSELITFIKDPLKCFPEALNFRNKDIHVLNRFGRSLRNKANFQTPNDAEKWNLLCDAYHQLTESIRISPMSNWFAYVTRMLTSKDLAMLCSEKHAIKWLYEARSDGIHCFNSKATDIDLCTLARVCQMLAKYPDVKKYGPKFVKNKEYIYEAIHYLNYALQLGGFINFTIVQTLSTCLYEIEEYRTAIEWMKRAMHLARKSGSSESLTRITQYIFALYKAKSPEGDPSRNYLLNEVRIDFRSLHLCKYCADGMIDFIKYLHNNDQSSFEVRKTLVSSCLEALNQWQGKKIRYQQIIKECKEKLKDLRPPPITVDQDRESSAQYTIPNIVMPFSMDANIQHSKYKFDFFVSHSNVNREWVNNYLLHQLETKLHDNDIAFKGCIADRNFTPGSTIISNIINAVEHSCKIIFVITEDFIKSRWCDYEVDQALVDMLSTKKEDCIIPILLENFLFTSLLNCRDEFSYLPTPDL